MNAAAIDRLIPQRAPIQLVDELIEAEGDRAVCSYTVPVGSLFIEEDGLLAEVGLIEHIAQSASALAGHKALLAGASEPPVGYIGEIKHFRCFRRPRQGDVLLTTVTMGPEAEGITLLTGETRVGDETVAATRLKILIREPR